MRKNSYSSLAVDVAEFHTVAERKGHRFVYQWIPGHCGECTGMIVLMQRTAKMALNGAYLSPSHSLRQKAILFSPRLCGKRQQDIGLNKKIVTNVFIGPIPIGHFGCRVASNTRASCACLDLVLPLRDNICITSDALAHQTVIRAMYLRQ